MKYPLEGLKYSLLLLFLLLPIKSIAQTETPSLPPDVRLVIDVSGSMKQNDPNNLRQPAVDLLVQLLPEDSKAGVWTFGRWVNMLVKHQNVNDAWRDDAQNKSNQINSVGLFTNIGEALEKALYDAKRPSTTHRTSIILLTDGMVDIDKNPSKNTREWRRIVDEVLPKIQAAGVTVHTVALSDNADTDLLNKLSLGTDGIASVAHTADDLMKIFLKAFDAAAPMEQVPLSDEGFIIDSSVEEFTALIFREPNSADTQLIGPDQEVITAATRSKYVNWHKADNYDLITVKQPLEGQWNVIADMQPDSRVTVVSNLNLRVKPLPNNVFKDQQERVTFLLQEDGKTITRAEFLSLMDISVSMLAGQDEFDLREIWKTTVATNNPPANGAFSADLPPFDKEGIYQLSIMVDGKSFVREFNHQFTTRQPFGADIEQVFNDGNLEYVLIARSYNRDVAIDKTQVAATVISPDGRKKIRPLSSTDLDTWKTNVRPEIEGEYTANIKVRGETIDGEEFDVVLDTIHFNYSIDGGFVEQKEEFFEPTPEATPEPTAEPTSQPTPEPTPAPEESEAEEEATEEPPANEGMPSWMLYTILGVGNLLLFGIGFIAFKKIMGSNKDDDILEQFSDANIEQAEPETEELKVEMEEEAEEEEPPMEDLDPVSDDVDELFDEPEPEPVDDLDPPAMEELEPPMDDPDPEPEPAMESMEEPDDDDPMDALDDLDEMAIEEENVEMEEATQEDEEEEDEEDMVAAMLKAQGLDLAEDELDDAISSLIDELGNDDSLDDEE